MTELEKVYLELFRGHIKARKGKRRTHDEHRYEVNLFENLMNTAKTLIDHSYHPSRGIAFVVQKPVIREIFAAPYRDRVVHHYIFDKVIGYWETQFIYDSYSCRAKKGTLKGIRRMEHFLRQASHGYKQETYIFKYDLSGYFMSLSHKLLYRKAIRGLKQQYRGHYNAEFNRLKFLWRQIIFDNPTDGVRLRGRPEDWQKLPAKKSLFRQPKGRGIVIGNLTSQLLSNIYLNDFDHYMKEWLGYKYYGRYVDDFYVIVCQKQYGSVLRNEKPMRRFLRQHGLRLNLAKTYRQATRHGVAFLGVVVFPRRTVAGKRMKRNFVAAFATHYAQAKFRPIDMTTMVSYAGFLVHHNCYFLTMIYWRKIMTHCLAATNQQNR